ncbi:hypothetical protein AVEN_218843-1 [Araneus ventricosus]|uniref:Uncharacterized protein n=1 Tax=Araneus ventricosus TaxID=182803 RepID=A0A4Y2HRF6_ARAVE|nr:hypothetical protein AVEN_218843-1 [Araneus ventricosus]
MDAWVGFSELCETFYKAKSESLLVLLLLSNHQPHFRLAHFSSVNVEAFYELKRSNSEEICDVVRLIPIYADFPYNHCQSLCQVGALLLPLFEHLLPSDDLTETLLHDVGESEHGDSEPAAQKSAHVTEDFASLRK